MVTLRLATADERRGREWMLVDPSQGEHGMAIGQDCRDWVDPSNDYCRVFTDDEILRYHLEPGWVWQEYGR